MEEDMNIGVFRPYLASRSYRNSYAIYRMMLFPVNLNDPKIDFKVTPFF